MQGLAGGLCYRREWEQVLGLHFQVPGYTSTGDDYTSRWHPPTWSASAGVDAGPTTFMSQRFSPICTAPMQLQGWAEAEAALGGAGGQGRHLTGRTCDTSEI